MDFQKNYTGMSDGERLMIAASRRDLLPEATDALDVEMARRRLSDQDARAKKREVTRLEIKEARKHQPSKKGSKYFVARINGWVTLLLAFGIPLLVLPLEFLHLIPKKWTFSILFTCFGTGAAIAAVQPWLRRTSRFWISLVVSCATQLPVGYWISVHSPPHTRNESKGAAALTIVAGYAVGIALFFLLQKLDPGEQPNTR